VLKKNIANIPDIARNIAVFAVSSERTRKMDSRTSGAFARDSIATNAASSTTAAVKKPSVRAEVQPADCAPTIA
jgi:hypothetical protein